jgi:WD40 repeat protein
MMDGAMSAIFISHSSGDRAFADELRDRLLAAGHRSLFLDYDSAYGIPPGREWERELYAQLRACQAVVVLCSERSMRSPWVFAEVTQAKALGKQLFPLRLDDAEIPALIASQQILDARAPDGWGRLRRALEAAGLDPAGLFDWDGSRPPYPGMTAFGEADAAVFFGRDAEVQRGLDLLNRLRRFGGERFALLLGASGSGKSSLLRAGLLPRLRRDPDAWLPLPATRPRHLLGTLGTRAAPASGAELVELLDGLRVAAGRTEASVLLPIDQAEELLGGPLVPLLRDALLVPDSPLIALGTLRSDFLSPLQEAFADVPVANLTVGPLSTEGLAQVIEGPAEKAGLVPERGLTQALVADTRTARALPLLAFALRELYEDRDRYGTLTLAAYRDDLGGLAGSVKAVADAVFAAARLSPELVDDLRDVFLAMVRVNDADRVAARPLRWADAPARLHPVLERFVRARLLVSRADEGDPILEVAHEALFSAWDRLRDWLAEDRDRLRARERLRQAALDWDAADRNASLLLHRGSRLAEAEELLGLPRFGLSATERDYLAAAIAERAAAADARRRQADLARVAIATELMDRDLVTAALMLCDVERPDETPFAVLRMNEVLARGLPVFEVRAHDGGMGSVSFNAAGTHVVSAAYDGTAKVWPTDGTGDPVVLTHPGQASMAMFSPDGGLVAIEGNAGISVWRADGTGRPAELPAPGRLAGFSPDGHRIATVADDGAAWIWRVDGDGEPLHLTPAHPGHADTSWLDRTEPAVGAPGLVHLGPPPWYPMRARPSGFSRDGQLIATAGLDGAVTVYRTDGSAGQWSMWHSDSVLSAELNSDGTLVFSARIDGGTAQYRCGSGDLFWGFGHRSPALAARFSPDGRRLIIVSADGTVEIHRFRGGSGHLDLRHDGPAFVAEFGPDGERLLTIDGTVRIWRVTGRGEPVVVPHPRRVVAGGFSSTGDRIVTATGDGVVRVWSVRPVRFAGPGALSRVAFSPAGNRLAAVSGDRTVHDWPLDARTPSAEVAHGGPVTAVAFSPDGRWLASASRDGVVRIGDVELRHEAAVTLLSFSPDGERLLTGAADGLIRVFRLPGTDPVVLGPPGSYKGTPVVAAASFSPDGRLVLGASGPVVRLWPADGGEPAAQLMARHYGGYIEEISHAWFTPDGRVVTVAGGVVRVWSDGEPRQYRHNTAGALAVCADGGRFVIASAFTDQVLVFDVDRAEEPTVLRGGPATHAAISADGAAVAAAGTDNTIRIWRGDGDRDPVRIGHEEPVRSLAFGPGGEHLLASCDDGAARVWRAHGGGEPLELWHKGAVNAAAFSPDGTAVVTAAEDGTARVWYVDGARLWETVRGEMTIRLRPEVRERYFGSG